MSVDVVGITWFALLGLVVGSFLNVCIYRLPREMSIVAPRSRCGGCGHQLAWYENVPVVSYLTLGGKCSRCRAPISLMYPIVEVVTGLTFALGYWWFGLTPLLAVRLLFACALIVLFVIDLQHQILPNVITLPGVVIGFLLSGVGGPGWKSSLIGIAVGAGSLFAVSEVYYRVRHEEGLGMGDVKMLGMIGAFLGWQLVLVTLMISTILGSIVGVGILLVRRETLKYALPFGTFLALAAIVAAVAGDTLVAWYLGFYI
jgi:leader peptidase (prepilin peptidase)/N-methyltransferase